MQQDDEAHRSLTLVRIRWHKKILLAGAACVVAGLLSELLLRAVAPQPPSWMPLFARHPSKPMFCVAPGLDLVADTGEARWRVCSDRHGLRVGAPGEAADVDADVLVLGDSFTFGYVVDYLDSVPAQLDQLAGERVSVVNAGQPAYGFQQYRMHLEHLLEVGFAPRGVLLTSFSGNDMFDALVDKDQPVADGIIGNTGGAKAWLKRTSHLYRLASKVYHSVGDKSDLFAHTTEDLFRPSFWQSSRGARAFARCREELRAITALCRTRGIELCLALLPPKAVVAHARGEASYEGPQELDWSLPHRKFRAAADDLGLRCVDLTQALAAEPPAASYFAFDGHLTPAGGALVARALFEQCSFLSR